MENDHSSYFDVIASSVSGRPLRDYKAEWDHVLSNAAYVPAAYTRSMVEYQSAYISERAEKFIDLSVVLPHDNRPVGIWPLNMHFSEGSWTCGSNEGPILTPLFVRNTAEKTRKALIERCLAALETLCRLTGQGSFKCVEFIGESGVDEWHRKIMERGGGVRRISHDLFVDLSWSIEAIRANVRKSYRPLLTQGEKLWTTSVMDVVDHETFEEFRLLHLQVAGRATRSLDTWRLQEEAISSGDAFLVVLRDGNGTMVGCGFFQRSATEGLYAVAAYDRTLFDKPLGHVVQMKAIEHMKALGVRWHKLGERVYPGDGNYPTDKELSIARFKEGFATHMFLRLHVECGVQSNSFK